MNDEQCIELKYNDVCTSPYRCWCINQFRIFRYRNGPVPGIRKRRGRCRWWHGRTLSQERFNEYLITDEEYEILPSHSISSNCNSFMSRRNWKECDTWNDVPRNDWRDRSWKRSTHRQKQYKT